jgi:hypothetical protein
MSWLYSRALVEEFSAASCSDGARSALSSGSHTPQAFLPSDKTTAFSRLSRFGMTFAPLMDTLGAELLMWFRAASPAKTFPLQARGQASTGSAPECGATWPASLARFDPASCSWRTAQPSLLGDSDECLVTWPRSGTTRNGLCWERPMLAPRTSATASGLWPAPVSDDTSSRSKPYAQGGTPLSLAVKLWPTPTTPAGNCVGRLDEWGGSRSRAVMRTLVTAEELGGPLNPPWVEWLMGWPLGWTDLKPLETDKSPSALLSHSPSLQNALSKEAA